MTWLGKLIRDDYIPFGKPDISEEEIAAVARVMRTGWLGMGPETQALERDLAEFLGAPHVVAVNSCTSALFLSLLVSGVGPGDEVLCPSLTWCSTANAGLYLGARVVLCDVDADSMCLTPQTVLEKMSPITKAVVVVHFGGLAADVRSIREAVPPEIVVVEDAAHALGARYADGVAVGGAGNLTSFSFYGNKNLAAGDGGAISLADSDIRGRLGSLRQNGLPEDAWKRFMHPNSLQSVNPVELGYKMNYTDLQASVARVQLRRQPEFQARRMAVAQHYVEQLTQKAPSVRFQKDILHPYHSRHLFVVRLPVQQMRVSRNEFFLELRRRNVGVSIHYPPLHSMELYCRNGQQGSLIATDRLYREVLTLPISASMTPEDANYVMDQFLEVFSKAVLPDIK